MSDFSDRPLIAGSMVGTRSFKVDQLGRLTGVSYTRVFTPGVNVATCARQDTTYGMAQSLTWFIPAMNPRPASVSLTKRPRHDTAGIACGCGYYAYFDGGTNTFHEPGQVQAVVEGFGTVTVGSRGFRAQRARLVALVRPPRWLSGARPFDGLADKLYDYDPLVLLGAAAGLGGLVTTVIAATDGPRWGLGVGVPLLVFGLALTYLMFRSITVHHDYPVGATPRSRSWALIRRNYPDVPVYSSMRAALRVHPLTPPPPPVQPSPENDPEFWTRQAVTS